MSGLCSCDRLDELLGRDVDAEVVDGEAGALEHDVDEVLADVVHVALDGAHDVGADLLRARLGEQRAEDVERALHRARGDEHLGHEEVAALEARADLLERRDERVVEHLLGVHAVGEALVDEVFHLGRVADERVVVEALEDLVVRHAAPRAWSRWPSRSASRVASSIRRGASCAMRSEVSRAVGPEMESAASGDAARPEDGSGKRAEAELELVDRTSRSRARGRARAPAFGSSARPKARKHLPLAASSNGTPPPNPVGDADEVLGVLLREVLDPVGAGDGEIDRLAARLGEAPQRRLGELDERAGAVAAREAEQDGPGPQPAAVAEPLHEALPLERGDEARGRALRQSCSLCELADGRRPRRLDDAHEQLRRTVDRLGAGGFGHTHMVEQSFHVNCGGGDTPRQLHQSNRRGSGLGLGSLADRLRHRRRDSRVPMQGYSRDDE